MVMGLFRRTLGKWFWIGWVTWAWDWITLGLVYDLQKTMRRSRVQIKLRAFLLSVYGVERPQLSLVGLRPCQNSYTFGDLNG
jgi:hypothetical protein